MRKPLVMGVLSVFGALGFAACGGTPNLAQSAAEAPKFEPKEGRCEAGKSQTRPLIVEWPSSDRAALEARMKQGVVPVKYVGCDMEVLTRCAVKKTAYSYTGITPKNDKVVIRNADELYANVPVYAAKLEGKLQKAGSLSVDMTIVGRYDAGMGTITQDQLEGDCKEATHVVTALTVGAFEFDAGASAGGEAAVDVMGAGAGAKSSSEKETLNRDGDGAACEKATGDDKTPPFGCGALLRIEVVPIGEARQETPTCPAGTSWDGKQCFAMVDKTCPKGMHFDDGKGCVADRAAKASSGPVKPVVPPPSACGDAAACGVACDKGDQPACATLASLLYGEGKGNKADGPRALDLAQKACDAGVLRGCVTGGEILYNAFGVPKDPSKSFPMFTKACDGGEPSGCVDVGWSYLYGMGAPKDGAKAAAAFGKACNGSSALGCVGLGMMYKNGNGVASDKSKANGLFQQACSAGVKIGCTMQ